MKQRVRLNESQLYKVIRRCVNEALGDSEYTIDNPYEIALPNRGETYYVWRDYFGDLCGTNDIENQRNPISNGRKKQVFNSRDGFQTVEDVERYVLKYFDK